MSLTHWGAHPADWHLLDVGMGLGADMLPVVSNPGAKISAASAMRDLGKVPSRYNRAREAVGIPGWTKHHSTDIQLAAWSQEPDYGICVQTRHVRAIDIDVPEGAKASEIVACVDKTLGVSLPMRWRGNSGKCLLAFACEGDYHKRSFRVKDKVVGVDGKTVLAPAWIVELLATGQQFVAFGTHPSGARIEWDWRGAGESFPALTGAELDGLWSALVERFALPGTASNRGPRVRQDGADIADARAQDTIAGQLETVALGHGAEGQVFIECPWSDEHSGDSGPSQTCYFPAGTRGYDRGHFCCLHASHTGKTDMDFMEALGLDDRGKDVAALVVAGGAGRAPGVQDDGGDKPLPMLLRDGHGAPHAIPFNVRAVLERPDATGVEIACDTFRDAILYRRVGDAANAWAVFTDEDYTRLRIQFDRMGFKPVGRDLVRDCVALAAAQNQFDSAMDWIKGLVWDGVPRVRRFAETYLGADPSDYAGALSAYLWTALAGRCLVPGIQADMAPVLVGAQGIGKSTLIRAIAPGPDQVCTLDLRKDDDVNARLMRGKLVAELAELKGLASRDMESIKDFITRTQEEWVPKFKEFSHAYPRRIVFIGTSNSDDFLADKTGNRRWLPLTVGGCDVAGVSRDREQLWAEGRVLFEGGGVAWREADRLAATEHDAYMACDPWQDAITAWLDGVDDLSGTRPGDREYLTINAVAVEALGLSIGRDGGRYAHRIGAILKSLGYAKRAARVEGGIAKTWRKRTFPL